MGMGCLGVVCVDLCIEWLLGMHWAGNGRGFHQVNRGVVIFGNSNRGFHYSQNSVLKYIFVKICVWLSNSNRIACV